MTNNKNGQFLDQVRSWLSDFRLEMNKLIGNYLQRIDELEFRQSKEQIAKPAVRVENSEVFEIDLKGGSKERL